MSSKQQQTEIRHISLQVITCEVEPYGLVLDTSTDDEVGRTKPLARHWRMLLVLISI